MAFVRVDIGFYTHRKTIRLFAKIGESAFWVPPRLWAYAAAQQIDGDFHDYSATEIAMLIGYQNDAQAMLQALIECGFMDVNPLRIHDWTEYNAYHAVFSNRAKNAARVRWEKERTKEKEEERRRDEMRGDEQASPSNASSNASSMTEFKLTGETQQPPSKAKGSLAELRAFAVEIGLTEQDGEWFFNKCEGCGWKNGKSAIKDWRATMRSWQAQHYFPSQKQNGAMNGNGLSIQELRSVAQAKELKAVELKRRYCSEVAMGETWTDNSKRQEFRKIRREIQTINDRISKFA